MSGANLLSLESALERILAGVEPLPAEDVALADARGRVLAVDATSRLTLPPWDNSAMDGYAVRAADVAAASEETPVELRVTGEAAAGHEPDGAVEPGSAMRVLTGGIVPPGADAVVKVEDTDAPAGVSALPERVAVRVAVPVGTNIRRAGSDVRADDPIVAAGRRLTPAAIAVLAATGHATLSVHRRPIVAVLATGDELVPVGSTLGPASIPDSNSESLSAQAVAAGADVIRLGIARDDPTDVRRRVREGIAAADVLVASGGVSVGAHDVVKDVFAEIGSLDLWRVAIQPGKPLAFGRASRPDGGMCRLFGLPGNPVSSFVTFELFVRPVVRRLRGESDPSGRSRVVATLTEPLASSRERRAFMRVRLRPEPDAPGRYRAESAGGQGSHVLTALALADGLAIIPEGIEEAPAGSEVEVIRLDVDAT